MLSPEEVARLAINLDKLKLAPVERFAVIAAIVDATMRPGTDTTSRRREVSSANSAAPPKLRKKARGRKGSRPGASIARARKVLGENPDLCPADLARTTAVFWHTARTAIRSRHANGRGGNP